MVLLKLCERERKDISGGRISKEESSAQGRMY